MLASNEPAVGWARGWAVSRGTPAPVEVPEGLRIDVGRPEHRVRYVIPRYDEPAVRALVDQLERSGEPGVWLKVCVEPAVLTGVLGDRWQVQPPEYLMSAGLAAAPEHVDASGLHKDAPSPHSDKDVTGANLKKDVPGPYKVEVVVSGDVIDTFVTTEDGQRAARGRAGLTGDVAVIDQVETEPEHRRRGLGRLVMRSMADTAVQHDATTGLLVATEDGRALYSSLGWTLESVVTAAVLT